MFNGTLFKRTFLSGYKILLVFICVMLMYFLIIAGMYDPKTKENMEKLMETLPKEMMLAFGFKDADSSFAGFLSSYYYGFIAVVFPMIYGIITANRLIARLVDRGSIAYLLSTPNKRVKIVLTQALFLILSTTGIYMIVFAAGFLASEKMFPGELDLNAFLRLNVGALLLQFAIGGISFFSSCVFNDTKNSLLFGAGIPVGFYIIKMLSDAGEKLEGFKYFTIFSLFNPQKMVSGEWGALSFAVLLAFAVVFYSAGALVFCKKDLSV